MSYPVSYDDSLSLFDGGSTSSHIVGKYCAYHAAYLQLLPPKHISSGNEMFIHFQYSEYYYSPDQSTFEIEYNISGKLIILFNLSICQMKYLHHKERCYFVWLFVCFQK